MKRHQLVLLNSRPTLRYETSTRFESFGASTGPLRGLVVTTDSRLQTLTLVGDSLDLWLIESYLKQIDLRQQAGGLERAEFLMFIGSTMTLK